VMAGFEGAPAARAGHEPAVRHDGAPSAGAAATPHRAGGDEAARRACLSGLHYLSTGDAQVEAVVTKVQRVLNKEIPLLILGETGTGKELLARAVHQDSNRARQAFVAVNCASIPESLIEAELFGYEDGAFTGARRKGATGRILQANGGTLFLDEIGDMPLSLQARLLRVLQERCVTPLGSHKSIPVDIAVVSATHRNLREMCAASTFREDLYYRLNGLVVRLPALRDRSDLRTVARRIVLAEAPDGPPEISAPVMSLFERYGWPGNIRQLANVLRTAVVMAGNDPQITEEHLSEDFLEDVRRQPAATATPATLAAAAATSVPPPAAPPVAAEPPPGAATAAAATAARTLGESEIALIQAALDAAGGNISEASKALGISRNTIYRKLRWR